MPITEQQLLHILPNAGPRAGVFVGALNRGMTRFGITSPVRAAAFLAQVGHESGQLTRLVENLNYSARGLAATWPSRYLGAGLGQPLEQEPELLEQPEWAALSAAWWWSTHGLNDLADRGEFAAITRRINGGTNGQAERMALWERAKAVLSCSRPA
ncbi:glycoside hydrolase family 19 protein [Pseudomonas aeruginosa]|nr:glycoside hydrolase family 19 protein [Pseudomonas aeruginosa]